VFDEYFADAEKYSAQTKNFESFHVTKNIDVLPQYLKSKKVFLKSVTRKTAHSRPAGFRQMANNGDDEGFLQYQPDKPNRMMR